MNPAKGKLVLDYFCECLKSAWAALDQAKIDSLIRSMPRRLEALRKARGWYTKYLGSYLILSLAN